MDNIDSGQTAWDVHAGVSICCTCNIAYMVPLLAFNVLICGEL